MTTTPAPVSAERERLIFEGLGTLPDELISQLSAARLAPYVIHLRDMLRADAGNEATIERLQKENESLSRRYDRMAAAIRPLLVWRDADRREVHVALAEYDRLRAAAGNDRASFEDARLGAFQIEMEKELCALVGRPWATSGFSIETLLADLRKKLNDRASAGEDGGGGDETVTLYRDVPQKIIDGMLRVLNANQHPDYTIHGGTLRDALCTLFACPAPTQPTPDADAVAAVAYANQKSLDRMQKAREKGHPGFLADISNLPIVMDGMTVPLYASPRAAVNPVVITDEMVKTADRAPNDDPQPPFEFDRYVNGELMAEGVQISIAKNLPEAVQKAARIASRGANGEAPVLVYRLSDDVAKDRSAYMNYMEEVRAILGFDNEPTDGLSRKILDRIRTLTITSKAVNPVVSEAVESLVRDFRSACISYGAAEPRQYAQFKVAMESAQEALLTALSAPRSPVTTASQGHTAASGVPSNWTRLYVKNLDTSEDIIGYVTEAYAREALKIPRSPPT